MYNADLVRAKRAGAAPQSVRRISKVQSLGVYVGIYQPDPVPPKPGKLCSTYVLKPKWARWRYKGSCRWVLVCESHGTVRGVRSLRRARDRGPEPHTWCPECAAMKRRDDYGGKPPAWLEAAKRAGKAKT